MTVVVVTPPVPVVTLEEAKAHLRVDDSDNDDLINGLVMAAQAHIDGPAGWLGRSVGRQTLELRLFCFHPGFRLPYGPIGTVDSITYANTAGADQVLPVEAWRLVDGNLVTPAFGQSWPAARSDFESVRVRYQAGFGAYDDEAPPVFQPDVPAPIKTAILLYAAAWFHHREEAVAGQTLSALPSNLSAEALLWPFRLFSL